MGFVKVTGRLFVLIVASVCSPCPTDLNHILAFVTTVFKESWDYSIVILGPLKYTPSPFDKVAEIDSATGVLTIEMTSLTCESKAGSVGAEEVQCWDATNDKNPVIMTFLDVKQLTVSPSIVTRRMSDNSSNDNKALAISRDSWTRRLQTSDFSFSCVQSEISLGNAQSVTIDNEKCQIQSGIITIEETQVVGFGVTTFTAGAALTGEIILPSPIQDSLSTIVRNCDSRWVLTGHTNLEIRGAEIKPGCHISASGSVQATAVLTVDLGTAVCDSGLLIELDVVQDEGILSINGTEIVSFGAPFADIVLVTSLCGDSGMYHRLVFIIAPVVHVSCS